ncbi:hypothetical protein [Candidatus Methylobacter favarea]|uniref:hypothetical protein n=1 Tax=Candidatus Methylobacter favarea TaxID=2707345 RepID=UPI00157C816D|nr:hypothetical protein [Candidatus Methylobacter favarea]
MPSIPLGTQGPHLKVTRRFYEQKKRLLKEVDEDELVLLGLSDEEYTRHSRAHGA